MKQKRAVQYRALETVEMVNDGRQPVDVRLEIHTNTDTPDAVPNRHVVTVETTDGSQYRYQRFGWDEPLTYYERVHAGGQRFQKRHPAPANVRAVVDAIDDDDHPITVDEDQLWNAEISLGLRDADFYDETRLTGDSSPTQQPAAADGPAVTDGGKRRENEQTDAETNHND